MNKPIKLFIGVWSLIMFIATLLLMREYCYVVEQSNKIVALKAEYENHLMAVSRIIHEYNVGKHKSDVFDSLPVDSEKKNDIFDEYTSVKMYRPHNAAHKTSGEVTQNNKDDFIVVNRRLDYIKQSSIAYLQKQNLDSVLHQINPNEWQHYTDIHKQTSSNKKRLSTTRRRPLRKIGKQVRYRQHKVYDRPDIEFSWPIERTNLWLSSFYGPRKKSNGARDFHGGVDMAACKGTPVYASAPGVVIDARKEEESNGYGNTVVIAHSRKYHTRYAHLHTIKVRTGQHVSRTSLIGTVGDTGHVRSRGKDASHLHFELHVYGEKVDPLAFLS